MSRKISAHPVQGEDSISDNEIDFYLNQLLVFFHLFAGLSDLFDLKPARTISTEGESHGSKRTEFPRQPLLSPTPSISNRRGFLKGSATLAAGFSALFGALFLPETTRASDSNLNILGPKPGYGPQVGTLVSMLTWMREATA